MAVQEALPPSTRQQREFDHREVRLFMNNPRPGFSVLYPPYDMYSSKPAERERWLMGVATGLTKEDYRWASFGREELETGERRKVDDGLLIKIRPEIGRETDLGIDVQFFDILNPVSRRTPMDGMHVLPTGEVTGVKDLAARYRGFKEEDLINTAGNVLGVAARAIREDRFMSLEVYWISKIEDSPMYPPSISPVHYPR